MKKNECNHKMVIYDSYESYAVCKLCGLHDWDVPADEDDSTIEFLKQKYPDAEVVDLMEDLREAYQNQKEAA